MANPSPQHTPTDGLGTPVAITLTCSYPAALDKVGSTTGRSPGNHIGGHQYVLTLSVAGKPTTYTTPNGKVMAYVTTAATLVPILNDASGLTFTPASCGTAAATQTATGTTNAVKFRAYQPGKASLGTNVVYLGPPTYSGAVLSQNVGQAIVEAYFPTYDTTDGTDFIYTQVLVNVIA